ncbi:hemerythrin domain-containing protein [Oceaniglobus roseus]|uniref:hemerythrin domain-containing protein n=1 Tax=Oceaniglobus roseus TaxID=1737570 RepID=UPI000C7F76BD|nr:hemerythrin domain-containing protein [Kandeliimicrobium roseum]
MTENTDIALEQRKGLPDALRVLADSMPRATWESHPKFDGLTRFWMERHLMFRELLGRLQAGTEGFLSGEAEAMAYGRETQRYAAFLLNQLHEHHHIEDHHYFPQMRLIEPRLERGFEILDADHHALDGHIHDLARGTEAVLRALPEGKGQDPAGALRAQLAGFSAFLDRHLEDEEDLIVPVILKHGLG